jgi:RNA polymerase subunit RPABC4/transcription elongation factor Spt4
MALIKCKECEKEISASARSCPGCGNPMKSDLMKGFICITTALLVLIAMSIQLMVARSPMFSGPQMMSPDMMGSPFEMNMPGGGGMNMPGGMQQMQRPGTSSTTTNTTGK